MAGAPGGFGRGLARAEDIDAQTAYNLELSRKMTVPDKIILDDSLSHQASPAHAFRPGGGPAHADMDEVPSDATSSLLDSRQMRVPERILYGTNTGTPSSVNPAESVLRHRLPEVDDHAVRQSPAMAMVTPPDRLTVVDQMSQATPVAHPASVAVENAGADGDKWESSSRQGTPPAPELAGHRAGIDDQEELLLQDRARESQLSRGSEDRLAALEKRVAELERGRGVTGRHDGDRVLSVLLLAFWLLNPLVMYFAKTAR